MQGTARRAFLRVLCTSVYRTTLKPKPRCRFIRTDSARTSHWPSEVPVLLFLPLAVLWHAGGAAVGEQRECAVGGVVIHPPTGGIPHSPCPSGPPHAPASGSRHRDGRADACGTRLGSPPPSMALHAPAACRWSQRTGQPAAPSPSSLLPCGCFLTFSLTSPVPFTAWCAQTPRPQLLV